MNKNTTGFTIVELLIVIVVIAILAAISIVAYNGIQARAHDTTVKNDLANFAKKIQLDSADRGSYILGGSASGDSTAFPGITFRPSKGSYNAQVTNLFYCVGTTTGGTQAFHISARSKSGNTLQYTSTSGLQDLGNVSLTQALSCNGLTDTSWSYGYYSVTNSWWGWAN